MGSHLPDRAPSATYYRANAGRWTAPFALDITSWPEWWSTPLGLVPRMGTLALFVLSRVRGLLRIDTSVDVEGLDHSPPSAVHRTWVRLGPLPLMASVERFVLDADGRRGLVEGHQAYAPLPGLRFAYRDSWLEVAADATSARYGFEVAGLAWAQWVRIDGATRVLLIETPWLRGEQRLWPR